MIRSPHCTYRDEETVLAHWRDGSTGMGQKEKDAIASWSCSKCHDLVDGRLFDPSISGTEIRQLHMDGIIRTQQQLIRDGIIKW